MSFHVNLKVYFIASIELCVLWKEIWFIEVMFMFKEDYFMAVQL